MSTGRMERILRVMAERHASDVFLSANMPVLVKIHGQMLQLSDQVLTPMQPRQLMAELLTPQQLEELDDTRELNVALAVDGVGSFRLSAFKQRGSVAGVVRHVPHTVPTLDSLNLPSMIGPLVLGKRGLVLVVGATGSGKSTTLASLLDLRNRSVPGHILTIEDPIEYLFTNKKCLVNQREVGRDTESFQVALRNALRQSPDCILIGEIRDRETMTAALSYSLSGHLVLASMHANNAYHALGRILSFYTPETRAVLLGDLAAGLRAVVSQRLLKAANGQGRRPAVEVLMNSNLVAELLEKGDLTGIKEAMTRSMVEGSRTFDEDIARLITEGVVQRDEGLAHADSTTDLLWRLQNDAGGAASGARTPPKREDPEDVVYTEFVVDVTNEGQVERRHVAPPPAPAAAAPATAAASSTPTNPTLTAKKAADDRLARPMTAFPTLAADDGDALA